MMTVATLKDHIKAGNCEFVRARAGKLVYRTALGLEFPVGMDTLGESTFDATIPAMGLMGYIRKQIAALDEERQRPDYQG